MLKKKIEGVKKAGEFTLIELLVVIAIIGILAAMLMPALNRARTAAHRVGSVSNMRQIAASIYYYANDHNSWLPFMRSAAWDSGEGEWDDTASYTGKWSRNLYEMDYISSPLLFSSPGRELKYYSDGQAWSRFWRYHHIGANPGALGDTEKFYRNFTEDTGRGFPRGQPLRLAEGGAPPSSLFLLLVDGWRTDHNYSIPRPPAGSYTITPSLVDESHRYKLYNYDGGIPRAYVDGRANAVGPVAPADEVLCGWFHEERGHHPPWDGPDCLGWHTSPTHSFVHLEENPFGGSGPYGGWWLYRQRSYYYYGSPWYTRWRGNYWVAPQSGRYPTEVDASNNFHPRGSR